MILKKILSKFNDSPQIISNFPDGVILISDEGEFIWTNDIADKMLSTVKPDYSKFFINDVLENSLELIMKNLDSGKTVVVRTKNPEKDMFIELNSRRTDEGLVVTLRDNTQNYKTLTSILVEHESSKKINKDKNNFLVKLENEFQAPLQSIARFSKSILDGFCGKTTIKQEQYLNIINKNSKDLAYLLDKVVELSKTEITSFQYKLEYFDVINVLNEVIKDNEVDSDINIKTEIDENLKRTIYSDEKLFKTILQNILENSIKFTKSGDITISIAHPTLELVNEKGLVPFENASEKSFIMINVNEKGTGISDKELNGLFDPYSQLDNPDKKNLTRSISFSIIKNILKLLKGNMWVDTENLKDSTYNIILPSEKVM